MIAVNENKFPMYINLVSQLFLIPVCLAKKLLRFYNKRDTIKVILNWKKGYNFTGTVRGFLTSNKLQLIIFSKYSNENIWKKIFGLHSNKKWRKISFQRWWVLKWSKLFRDLHIKINHWSQI
jgi:hypothetical protein